MGVVDSESAGCADTGTRVRTCPITTIHVRLDLRKTQEEDTSQSDFLTQWQTQLVYDEHGQHACEEVLCGADGDDGDEVDDFVDAFILVRAEPGGGETVPVGFDGVAGENQCEDSCGSVECD